MLIANSYNTVKAGTLVRGEIDVNSTNIYSYMLIIASYIRESEFNSRLNVFSSKPIYKFYVRHRTPLSLYFSKRFRGILVKRCNFCEFYPVVDTLN